MAYANEMLSTLPTFKYDDINFIWPTPKIGSAQFFESLLHLRGHTQDWIIYQIRIA